MANGAGPLPLLYAELAEWFCLVTPPEDYAGEAELYAAALEQATEGEVRRVLELGSGGGNNAYHLKRRFGWVLTDLSPAMLEVSRRLNPELEHLPGDMRTLRLGRTFDAVFAHDAIGYMTTPADLKAAMHTAYQHLRPGGAALFGPDHTRETFQEETSHGGTGGGGLAGSDPGLSLRYLEWTWDPDPEDDTYVVDFAYLLRDRSGRVSCRSERHTMGLFSRATWLRLLGEVGFRPGTLPFRPPGSDREHLIFTGRRPG